MKEIPLTKGYVAIVDDEDYELVNQWKWCYSPCGKGYATRAVQRNNKIKNIQMHRIIVNANRGEEVDHINGNSLDNRRSNLRICESKNNSWNTCSHKDGTSKYKGVFWNKQKNQWQVKICCNYKTYHVGFFDDEEEAAYSYDVVAKRFFGEYARLNGINRENISIHNRGSSIYRGVHWHSRDKVWEATITFYKKRIHLGRFNTDKEAAVAYNNAALKYLGDKANAKLNIVD